MSDGNYDRALLSQADDSTPTNGRNKQFYDADLLKEYDEQERQRQAAPASRSQTDLENGHGRQKDEYATASTPLPPKRPWYKTRNGIIAIVVITIVVLGAVIGGAVGGTSGKGGNKNSQTTITAISPTATASSGGAATAGVATGAPSGGQAGVTASGKDNIAVPTAGVSDPESAGTSA